MVAVVTGELIGANGAYLLDSHVRFEPRPWLELTVGFSKPPLFASFRHERIPAMPMPVRSGVVKQLWVRRDVGVEARFMPRRAPIEALVRLGNGSMDLRDNTNETPSGYAALDLVLGRLWAGAPATPANELLGLRFGAAALVDDRSAHESVAAETPFGYVYAQPVVATGLRVIATGHLIGLIGPVRVIVEGGMVQAGREDDHDGDPATPAQILDPVRTWGLTGELTWTIRGGWRGLDQRPEVASLLDGAWDGGALELSARADRFWLNYGAADLVRTGGTSGSLALKWYPTRFMALTAYGEATAFEHAPIATPGRLWGGMGLLRASFYWPG